MARIVAYHLVVILFLPFWVFAQQQPKVKTVVTRTNFTIDDNSVVKDEQGKVIAKEDYYKAAQTGDYSFKPVKDKQGKVMEFTLVPNSKIDTAKNKNRVTISTTNPEAFSGLLPGASLPFFRAKNLTGETVLSESLKGKIVVFNFWLTRFPACIETMPEWNKLFLKYENNPNVVFIAPTGEKADSVKAFMSEDSTGFFYSVIPDAKDLINKFNVRTYPSNIIFDQHGRVYASKSCWNNSLVSKLDADIRKLLAQSNQLK
jgi:peroxiredoxin